MTTSVLFPRLHSRNSPAFFPRSNLSPLYAEKVTTTTTKKDKRAHFGQVQPLFSCAQAVSFGRGAWDENSRRLRGRFHWHGVAIGTSLWTIV